MTLLAEIVYNYDMSEISKPTDENEQTAQEYKVSPIPKEPEAQEKRGWRLELNGQEIKEPIEVFSLRHTKMGVEIAYGQRQEGFDGPVLKEPGGGGAVTIPYFMDNGELYVAMAEEARPTCTDGKPEKVLNVPRGFLDPGQTHFETAKKELLEETGYEPIERRIVELPGKPMNPNSTFFVTGHDKGVRMYGVRVYDFEINETNPAVNPTDREYQFDKSVLKPTSKVGEKISGSKFVHWTKAVQEIDMFSAAAVARIQASQTKK